MTCCRVLDGISEAKKYLQRIRQNDLGIDQSVGSLKIIGIPRDKCAKIGPFLKVLGDLFVNNVAQIFGNLFGYCKKHLLE